MTYWNKYGSFLDYIGLKSWDIFLNWFWFVYLGICGNWNLIAKNNFQFIELIIAKIILIE